ncbi:hypothetical protein OX283_011570 [Flavobacterium sp. SUN052]|uniref:hypothetical protein n=1 Tax=Flavobacterium sp. SUN052 TaxID=3002441 RepID=UPI00237EBCDF|nr:hypothetical protein [Flavobacterium sp. SUN052]MEC4005296.1 hypothetical protein [Flavobacterium sp. SUN052]
MKKTFSLLFIILGITTGFSQEDDRPENTGDNFSLEGALALFKKSNSLEEFEKSLNEQNNNVNNLDLNNDGDIDYITVDDIQDGDAHAIVLSTYINETEKQDIALIGVEKIGTDNAVLQIEGDKDLFAENTVIEPTDTVASETKVNNTDTTEYKTNQASVNVWLWPSVRYIYAPSYVIWHSPWRWRLYPKWWRPWRPIGYTVFYRNCAPHRVYYHRVATRRVLVANRVYAPRRHSSTLVIHNRRGTTVIHENRRGNVRAVKVRNGGVRVRGRGRR